MQNRELWIDSVMNSLDNTARATAPVDIEVQVMKRVQRLSAKIITLPRRTIYLAAAGMALLITLNYYMISSSTHTAAPNNYANQDPITTEYFPNSSVSI